jgi:hypothetical protein
MHENDGVNAKAPTQSHWRRKLRISASLFFGLLALVLCLLSIRSHWRFNLIRFHGKHSIALVEGHWLVNDVYNLSSTPPVDHSGIVTRIYAGGALSTWSAPSNVFRGVGVGGRIPVWPFIAVAAALSAAPWLRYRFSLRTLLIATTLVAIVLGLAVWAMR